MFAQTTNCEFSMWNKRGTDRQRIGESERATQTMKELYMCERFTDMWSHRGQ